MAERGHWWTERWLRSPLSLSLSFSLFLSLSSTYLPIYVSIYLSICLSVYLSICKRENEAILRDFLSFWTWQHLKRSNFCEISSFSEVDNIKIETILRDFLQKWKVECRADGLVPMRFAVSSVHLSKVLRLPRKSDARSYEVLHLSRKIISANLKIWCSKMQPVSGNQRPDRLTALMNMSLVLRLPRKMHLCRSSKCPTPAVVFGKPSRFAHFWQGAQSLAPATQNDIWTSKSGPHLVCFVHFDFEMCFAPQRRTLVQHLNCQKWSAPGVFCTFWLANVLRATTACNCSSLIWPAGSAPAALASLHKSLEKHSVSRLSYLFGHLDLLSSETFSSLIFSLLLFSSLFFCSTSAFHLSILSELLLYKWMI